MDIEAKDIIYTEDGTNKAKRIINDNNELNNKAVKKKKKSDDGNSTPTLKNVVNETSSQANKNELIEDLSQGQSRSFFTEFDMIPELLTRFLCKIRTNPLSGLMHLKYPVLSKHMEKTTLKKSNSGAKINYV